MIKYVRDNQKKVLAILCVVSMVMFIYGLAPHSTPTGVHDIAVATLDGATVMKSQMDASRQEWQILKLLEYVNPTNPNDPNQGVPFVRMKLEPQVISEIENKAESYFLLVQEALLHDCAPPDEEVQTYLRNYISNIPPTLDEDSATKYISDLLAVRAWLDQTGGTIKITRPLRNLAYARNCQIVSINCVSFPAARYLPEIPPPTDAQILQQYANYKSFLPGSYGSSGDPLGFGYSIPERYKIQFISLKHDAVREIAIKSKSELDWYQAAYGEFSAHRERYDNMDVPSTEPSTQPSADSSTQPSEQALQTAADIVKAATQMSSTEPAATQLAAATSRPAPAPRKIDDLGEDFRIHAKLVLDVLYDQETENLQQNILKKINDGMSSGFGSYKEASASGGAATQSGTAAAYIQFSFISDLAGSIESQFHVLPTTDNVDQFKSAAELPGIAGIGQAYFASGQQPVNFQNVVTKMAQAPWQIWQPSPPIIDSQNNFYVFRISAIDLAHPMAIDEVKDRVTADFKLAAAYDQATTAAQAFLTRAQSKGFRVAAAAASATVATTDEFSPDEILANPSVPHSISPLNLKPESARAISAAAEQLVNTPPPTPGGRPVSVAPIYPDAIAMVIELNSATPKYLNEPYALIDAELSSQLHRQDLTTVLPQFCTYEAIAQRLNFKPNAETKNLIN